MSDSETALASESTGHEQTISALRTIFGSLLGVAPQELDVHTHFIEMGIDSLALLQASQKIHSSFGVKLPFRRMLEEFSNLAMLAGHLDQQMQGSQANRAGGVPPARPARSGVEVSSQDDAASKSHSAAPSVTGSHIPAANGSAGALDRILAQQLQIMAQQLELLRSRTSASQNGATRPVLPVITVPAQQNGKHSIESPAFVAFEPIRSEKERLNSRQREHLDSLVQRLSLRLSKSQQAAENYRSVLADNRATAGFRMLWKQLQFPLIASRAEGAHLWDIDGNEYIDITMGFGALLFGHSPDFIVHALQDQISRGFQLGAESRLAGEAAALLKDLTGVERVTFCNSGTEAVMSALRLARTVTGRTRIAMFEGCYHGTFDGVLIQPDRSEAGITRPAPLAPGVPRNMIDDVLLLKLNDPASLEVIKSCAHELAAVLLEPLPSRFPDLHPKEFLQTLRAITNKAGVALIFDEIVTGFRFHPGGAQAVFGVQADLVTYGKAVGGGLPVSVVAGKARYMDAIDGGAWSYHDDSYPAAETTYFAGTYFKHPLVMAGLHSLLKHIKDAGPRLQEDLSRQTAQLADTLNRYFDQEEVPVRVAQFGSLFRFLFHPELKHTELFYFHMLEAGVYICETRNCFLSTAHSDHDLEKIVQAVKVSIARLREGGFLPEKPVEKAPAHAAAPFTLPLTESQRDLWTFAQMSEEASQACNESLIVRLRGPLQLKSLQSAIGEVGKRHEATRATLLANGEGQTIGPDSTLELLVSDLSVEPEAERETLLAQWRTKEASQVFDLVRGPLMRFRLIKLGEQDHVLIFTAHHLVTDGVSNGLLMYEISRLYSAACQGRVEVLAEPMPFSEYLRQQMGAQSGQALQDEQYWLKQLAGVSLALNLPLDKARPAVQTHHGARLQSRVDGRMVERLRALSAQHQSTLFMTLLAAWTVLLQRLSCQREIVIGIPVAGQSSMGSNPLVGYCVNLVPFNIRVDSREPFTGFLRRVKESWLAAYSHGMYPLSRLAGKLNVARDPGWFFAPSAAFNLDRSSELEFHGLAVEMDNNSGDSAKFEIYLNVTETNDGLVMEFEYNRDLFEESTVRQWSNRMQVLLEDIVSSPGAVLSDLSLVSEEERAQLKGFNRTWSEYPRNKCVHELVEEQARMNPQAVAVACGERVRYAELNRRANQLARYLRKRGAGAEQLVGVCLERSVELVVTLLAVLKAGSAYLPLEAEYPQERIGYMVEHSRVRMVVSNGRQGEKLKGCRAEVIGLEERRAEIERESGEDLGVRQWPEGLAYVMYTSGSTGQPKGIGVTHGNIVRLVRGNWYARLEGETVLGFAPISFDASTFEVWGPLCGGGRIALLGEERPSLEALGKFLREEGVTTAFLTTALFNALVDGDLEQLQGMRQLLTGGEVMSARHVRVARAALKQCCLVNIYGPTENTTFSSWYEVGEVIGDTVPIGKPIANTRAYVLDGELEWVGIGMIGELYLGGEGVARGYIHDGGQTAERFLPDIDGGEQGERMYRTGDLVKWRGDGNLEFIGRVDGQVKVRGFRIECGEIESRLKDHGGVKEAVVVVKQEAGMEKRLVGYVLAAAGGDGEGRVKGEELRRYLQGKVPEYMVPAAIKVVEGLPLNANGKVDRQELAKREIGAEREERAGEERKEPEGEVEEKLARIWAEVLRVKGVGAEESFFELGGDSILAIQISARAKQAGLQVKPKQIFEGKTVRGVAQALGKEKQARAEQAVVTGEVPLTPIQHWFFEQQLHAPDHSNMPMLMGANQQIDVELWKRAVAAVLNHHDGLRLRFRREGSGYRQYCAGPEEQAPLEVVDLRGVEAGQRQQRMEEHAARMQQRLSLESGPLVRVALYEMGDKQRVLMVVHHLAVDVVSWRVLLEDLWRGYEQLARGEKVDLGEKTTSYKEWGQKLEKLAQSREMEEEVRYWEGELEGVGGGSGVVVEKAGENLEGSGGVVEVELGEEETEKLLREVAREQRARASEVMISSLGRVLRRWTGEKAVVVDVEGHGREESEVEGVNLTRTVGWFTVIYPVVLRQGREGEGGVEELRRVKEKLRRIPRGGIGYGLLKYKSGKAGIRERMKKLPTAQVSFNYLGQMDQDVSESAVFGIVSGQMGSMSHPSNQRSHLIEVAGSVVDGRLRINIGYSRNLHSRQAMEQLAESYLAELKGIIRAHCLLHGASYTPSDFPLASLDENALNRLLVNHAEVEDIYPLSPTQQEMLFHSLALRESELGFVQLGLTLDRDLDPAVFKRAWEKVLERHENLRSSVAWDDQVKPLQIVHSRVALPWQELDWKDCAEEDFAARFEERTARDRRTGFDYARAPLMRLVLIHRSDGQFSFIWSFHHLLLDGWSLPIVFRELWMHYQGLLCNQEPELGVKPLFRDYISWLTRQNPSESKKFWRDQLLGFTSPVALLGDTGSAAPISAAFMEEESLLSEGLTRTLESVAQQSQVTLNTLFAAGWALLLSRYSGQNDIVFGITVSGRPSDLPGIENMVGLFINTLPLRLQIRPGIPVVRWLQEVQSTQMALSQFQHTPRSLVQNCSDLPAGLPLFQSTLVFENYPFEKEEMRKSADTLQWSNDYQFGTRTSTPLSLIVVPGPQIRVRIAYDTRRFSPVVIQRMIGHLESLLKAMSSNPAGPLADLAGAIHEDAQFRADSMVQVPGRRIPVSRIQRELSSYREIKEVAVVACEDTAGEPRAAAYFTSRSNSVISVREIRAFLRERLPESMLPSDYVQVPEFAKTASGEIDLDALPAPGFVHSFSRVLLVGDIASHDILEFQLARIWEEVFGIRPINPDDNFFALGGDSLTALALVSRIRDELSYDLPLAALFEGATIQAMASVLRRQSGATAWSSLVPIQPQGSRPPFFCIHAAGGNVLGFVDVVRHIDKEQPFYGLQSVGLDGLREPYSRVEEIAAHYIDDIRAVQPEGPYFLGGLSFGGLVAFEMARQLRQAGESIALLALIDTWAPIFEGELLFRQVLPPDDFTLLTYYIRGIRTFYEQYPEKKRELEGLTFPQQIDRVLNQMDATEMFGNVSREHARRVLQIHLHSARAVRDYSPQMYDGKVTVLRAASAGEAANFVIVHPAMGQPKVMAGWQQISTEPLEVIDVPGDHITMIAEPNARILAERLNECLERAQCAFKAVI